MPLTPEQLTEQAADHNCQTPDCPNLYDIVFWRVRDGDNNWLCWSCFLPFATTLVQGMIDDLAPAIAAAAEQAEDQTAVLGNLPAQTPDQPEDLPLAPPERAEDILARYRPSGAAPAAGE